MVTWSEFTSTKVETPLTSSPQTSAKSSEPFMLPELPPPKTFFTVPLVRMMSGTQLSMFSRLLPPKMVPTVRASVLLLKRMCTFSRTPTPLPPPKTVSIMPPLVLMSRKTEVWRGVTSVYS